MKTKRFAAAVLAVVLLIGATSAFAAAGGADDPLISLTYLTETYMTSFAEKVKAAVSAAFDPLGDRAEDTAAPGGSAAGRFTVHNLGSGSVIELSTGGSVIVYSGKATITFASGAVVDVTAGKEITSGVTLTKNSRYMAAEDTAARVSLSTACRVAVDGAATVTKSGGKTTPFVDVAGDDWFFDYVVAAVERGLVNGKTAYTYEPASSLTLAEAVKLASTMHQLWYDGEVTLTGSGAQWYAPYVDYAVENDIVGAAYASYTAPQFNAPVTRAVFVSIFYNALPAREYVEINSVADNAIPDVKTADVHAAEIYAFYRAGILTGSDAAGTFNPESGILRREVAAIVSRMFERSLRQSVTLG